MKEKEFFDLCYDRLKTQELRTGALYGHAGMAFSGLAVIGAASFSLGDHKAALDMFGRVDLFLYSFSTGLAFLSLAVSIVFLAYSMYPRTNYLTLNTMDKWDKWRKDILAYCQRTGDTDAASEQAQQETLTALLTQITDAEAQYSRLNELRMRAFKRAVFAAGVATCCMGIQALFYFLLKCQGII